MLNICITITIKYLLSVSLIVKYKKLLQKYDVHLKHLSININILYKASYMYL